MSLTDLRRLRDLLLSFYEQHGHDKSLVRIAAVRWDVITVIDGITGEMTEIGG